MTRRLFLRGAASAAVLAASCRRVIAQNIIFPGPGRVPGGPPWLPLVGTTKPVLYADFTTEGTTNNYWYNGTVYGSFASWLAVISGTFTRASPATYTNSSGLLASAGNNVLRFNYDPVALTPKGILLEGASMNVCLHSQELDDAVWTAFLTGVTVSANAIAAPDGTTTADKLAEDNSNGLHQTSQSFTLTAVPWTWSVYAKAAERTWLVISAVTNNVFHDTFFDLSNGVVGTNAAGSTATINNVGNGWYRCTVTRTGGTGASQEFFTVGIATANNTQSYLGVTGNGIYLWGAQLEALAFASSYIPTTSGTVQRVADILTVPWTATTATFFSNTINQQFVSSRLVGDNNAGSKIFQSSSSLAATADGAGHTLTTGITSWSAKNVIAAGGTTGSRGISANGNPAATDSNNLFASAPTSLEIGSTSSGSNVYGNYQQFGAWTIAATATQLQTLTT